MPHPTHTPEPWTVHASRMTGVAFIADQNQTVIATMDDDGSDVVDADRIVACVNACAGINPDAVPALLEALRRIAGIEARSHRAGRNVVDKEDLESARRIARTAIAKATPAP